MIFRFRVQTLAALFFFVVSGQLVANEAPGMTPVDLLNLPRLSQPTLSPDGKHIVYAQRESNWKENKQVGDLWLWSEGATPETRRLTFNSDSEGDLEWSPDGRFISFTSERDDDKHDTLYLLPLAGGEAYPVVKHDADIRGYAWSKDSKSIYFLADEPLDKKIRARKNDKDDMFAFEESQGFRHLWKLDLASEEVSQLTSGAEYITRFSLSQDGRFMVLTKAPEVGIDDRHEAELWLLPISDNNGSAAAKRITSNTHAEYGASLSPDNKKIAFVADVNEKGEYYYDGNLFVIDIVSGKTKLISASRRFEVEDFQWSNNSKAIFVQANMGVHSELWRLNINNDAATQLSDGKHTIKNWNFNSLAKTHVFTVTTADNPGDIWRMKAGSRKILPVTTVFSDLAQRFKLPEQRLIRWKTADGVELEGLLSLPLNYQKGKRYPLVTYTHGGPRSSDQYGQFRWRSAIPVLADLDYAYLTVNHRGGRGYGDDFMRDMVGGYFNNAHLDVLSGIDYLIEQGIADPEQLLVTGWSAGGHMTNKLITVTNRFKAASSGAGAVDWVSMYGETDTRYGRTAWFGGTPWQRDAPLDAYREQSPLKDMWKVKTPTLIFVGEKDVRVPATQSKILFRALRDLGVETKLYIAPREPHGYRELRHRLFKINAELEWFELHARGREYQWQPIPKSDEKD